MGVDPCLTTEEAAADEERATGQLAQPEVESSLLQPESSIADSLASSEKGAR